MLIATAADAADALKIAFYISAAVVGLGLLPATVSWIILILRSFGVGLFAGAPAPPGARATGPYDIFKDLVKQSARVAYNSASDAVTRTMALGIVLVVLGLIPTMAFGAAWATAAGLQDSGAGGGSTTNPTGTAPTTTGP